MEEPIWEYDAKQLEAIAVALEANDIKAAASATEDVEERDYIPMGAYRALYATGAWKDGRLRCSNCRELTQTPAEMAVELREAAERVRQQGRELDAWRAEREAEGAEA